MTRAMAGTLLLGAAGPLVFAAGFIPWGHTRTHWGVLSETVEVLVNPPEDEPLTRFQVTFWGGEVAGLAYPMVAGLAIFLSAFLVRGRAAGAAVFLLHAVPLLTLAGAAAALALPNPEMSLSGKHRLLLAVVAAAMAALFIGEVIVLIRAARPSGRTGGYLVDRLNFLPAAFLLILNAALWIVFSRGSYDWTWQGYPVGAAGCAAALLGMKIRTSGRLAEKSPR